MLLARNLIDEVHVWDFCVDNQTNREFIHSFMNSTNRDPRYVLMTNPPELKNKYVSSRTDNYLWDKYYDHYSTDPRYKDEDILLKVDDDIVFLDVNKFGDFLGSIKTLNLYFPNIVNNDAGLYIQGQRKAHPSVVQAMKYYEDKGINFEKKFNTYFYNDFRKMVNMLYRYVCPLSSYECSPNSEEWRDGIFARGDMADDTHVGFLENPEKFIEACSNENLPRMVILKQRISVNMFAGKMMLIKKIYSTFINHMCCDDEGYIGKWPSLTHIDHIIDTHFTVVHFAFNLQYENDKGKDLSRLIAQYDALASQIEQREKEKKRETMSGKKNHLHRRKEKGWWK